jgi:uncharacterized membrane protein
MLQQKAKKRRKKVEIISYVIAATLIGLSAYVSNRPREFPEEFYVSQSPEALAFQDKYLNGMRDGGYALDRNLRNLGERSSED